MIKKPKTDRVYGDASKPLSDSDIEAMLARIGVKFDEKGNRIPSKKKKAHKRKKQPGKP